LLAGVLHQPLFLLMKISIISVFPEIHETFIKTSLVGRAQEKGLIEFNLVRFSDMCSVKERIDQPTCGPGAGMIIKPEVFDKAIQICEEKWGLGYKIFLSPQGEKLTQPLLKKIAQSLLPSLKLPPTPYVASEDRPSVHPECPEKPLAGTSVSKGISHIILICPRYEGIDERVQEHYADLVLSIGDYVLMGGDLPAQVFLEGFLRLIPGIVQREESVEKESFSSPFLDHPEYGLPVQWRDKKVPDIILSGNHGAIEKWRAEKACEKTILSRFDWFTSASPCSSQIKQAQQYIPSHYVVLMHDEINLKDNRIGTTSVASLDIHDAARSCATYGIKNYFMVSPLKDQQKIMRYFLSFWHSDAGKNYNKSRHDAVSRVMPMLSLDETIATITEQEGCRPLLIATSAKPHDGLEKIDFFSQSKLWQQKKPILFVFGTGQGLADQVLDRCDFILHPIEGMTNYNHLSVRAAVAIILDRWLGLHPRL